MPARARDIFFLLQNRPDRLWGPPNLILNGYGGSLLGVKQSCESWPSSLSGAELKNGWSYTSTPPLYAFLTWTGTALPFWLGKARLGCEVTWMRRVLERNWGPSRNSPELPAGPTLTDRESYCIAAVANRWSARKFCWSEEKFGHYLQFVCLLYCFIIFTVFIIH